MDIQGLGDERTISSLVYYPETFTLIFKSLNGSVLLCFLSLFCRFGSECAPDL
jgi:hypothetical protein